jgi:glutathione peroxidase
MDKNLYSFTVKKADGQPQNLEDLKGQVVLVVNVASKCGFTGQYEGLEALYKKFQNKKFNILGFPCNQFGGQEPGTNEEIQSFCKMNYGVSFPVLAKIEVNGNDQDPLYAWLKNAAPGILGIEAIKWNFTKFLVGADGQVIKRYAPQAKPEEIEKDIEEALNL